jgi:hypothetical protein
MCERDDREHRSSFATHAALIDTTLHVGDPEKCKEVSDLLLAEHGIYVQPINYPTVAKGTERLRITPTPHHDDGLIDSLTAALVDVWQQVGLPFKEPARASLWRCLDGALNALQKADAAA